MSEFSIIDRHCKGIGALHEETILGVGDDAAVVSVPSDHELAVSVDTMVEGVHFDDAVSAAALAHKLLAVNLSDMAAMGAEPKWATLALTLANTDERWLAEFSAGLHACAKRFGVELIGGDTTHGPLTASLQILGLIPRGQTITRSGAREGDWVYVSGALGDAALALQLRQQGINESHPELDRALDQPEPQIGLGLALRQLASAAIDISDGLLADLGHIARASNVSIEVLLPEVPLSDTFLRLGGHEQLALCGGDDYQLAFTVPPDTVGQMDEIAHHLNVKLTRIGLVTPLQSDSVLVKQQDGSTLTFDRAGFEHFAK